MAWPPRHVRDERLRTALSFHPLFIGGNPFAVTAIYALVIHLERSSWRAFRPWRHRRAGARACSAWRKGRARSIRYGAEVAEITVAARRATGVRLASGRSDRRRHRRLQCRCRLHLWQAAAGRTARKRWTDRKLARARHSMSVVVWYFGTRRRYEDVPHHAILFGPRYRGLIDDIFENKVLSEDFSLYLHRPTATDPSLAPAGCDAFYALVPVPNLQGGTDWQAQAEPFRQRIQAAAGGDAAAGAGRGARHLAADDAARLRARAALGPRRRLRARAAPAAERLVPPA